MLLDTDQITTCFKSSHCLALLYQLQKTNLKKKIKTHTTDFSLCYHIICPKIKNNQNPLSG